MTQNHHGITSLEKKCDQQVISLPAKDSIEVSGISFFQQCEIKQSMIEEHSVIHSNFTIDHAKVNIILASLEGVWKLGTLG